jgi:hypothetical protein
MTDLTFTVRRLLVRDELVFKSIVRILHRQTRHNWLYMPDIDADLVVVGPAADVEACPDSMLAGRTVMDVGASELSHQPSTVNLRVGDVLAKLNGFGDRIVAERGPQPKVAPRVYDASRDEQYMLVRWPDWGLMQEDRAYLRVATVLATRPVCLHELAVKADAELALCVDFVRKLRSRDLIRITMPQSLAAIPTLAATSVDAPAPKDGSLWSRIRHRLGIAR